MRTEVTYRCGKPAAPATCHPVDCPNAGGWAPLTLVAMPLSKPLRPENTLHGPQKPTYAASPSRSKAEVCRFTVCATTPSSAVVGTVPRSNTVVQLSYWTPVCTTKPRSEHSLGVSVESMQCIWYGDCVCAML